MEFKLTKEQKRLRKDIVRFAREQLRDETFAERDEKRQFSRKLWAKCGEMRIPGLHVPEAYGGRGYDAVQATLALEGLGYGAEDHGLLLALGAHMFGAVVPIVHFGDEAQKQKYLPKLADGSWIAACTLTESAGDSDLDSLAATATAEGNGFCITGEQVMGLNATVADVFLVYAVTDASRGFEDGVTCFLIEKEATGLSVEPAGATVGYRTAPMGHITFDAVKVKPDALLGGPGNGAAVYARAIAWERTLIAAAEVGRMDRLLETSITYARTRKSGGRPIGKYQSVSHKITDMKIRLEVARLLCYKAAWQLDGGKGEVDASVSKLFASDSMMQSSLDAAQILGGRGFFEEYGIGRSLRDALGGTLYAGTAAIQRNAIAKAMGVGH